MYRAVDEGSYTYGLIGDEIENAWPYVKDYIKPAVENTNAKDTLKTVLRKLRKRHYQLWLIVDENKLSHAALVTEVYKYKQDLCGGFVYLGGKDLKRIIALVDIWEQYFKEKGCKYVTAHTRKGIVRAMKKIGYENIKETEFGIFIKKRLEVD